MATLTNVLRLATTVGALAGVIVVTHALIRNPLDDPDAFWQSSSGLLEGERDPDSLLAGALVALYATFAAVAATFLFRAYDFSRNAIFYARVAASASSVLSASLYVPAYVERAQRAAAVQSWQAKVDEWTGAAEREPDGGEGDGTGGETGGSAHKPKANAAPSFAGPALFGTALLSLAAQAGAGGV